MKLIAVVLATLALASCKTCPTVDEQKIKDHYYNLGQRDVNRRLLANNKECFVELDAYKDQSAYLRSRLAECLDTGTEK